MAWSHHHQQHELAISMNIMVDQGQDEDEQTDDRAVDADEDHGQDQRAREKATKREI